MPIKGRKNIPDPTTQAEYKEEKSSDARSAHLQGLRLDVWQFINDNPGCTRDDVSRALSLKSSTATARIKELIDEGFVIEPGGRKLNKSGVRAKVLTLNPDRKAGGKPLDRVRVEVTLTIDCNGVYGAQAKVIGGKPQAKDHIPILGKRLTLTAPHPDTYKSAFIEGDVVEVSRAETVWRRDDIIEADYQIIEDD